MFLNDEKTKIQINIYIFTQEEKEVRASVAGQFESHQTEKSLMFLHMEQS